MYKPVNVSDRSYTKNTLYFPNFLNIILLKAPESVSLLQKMKNEVSIMWKKEFLREKVY